MDILESYVLNSNRLNDLMYKTVKKKQLPREEIVKDKLFWFFYKLFNKNYTDYPDFEKETNIKFEVLTNYDKNKSLFKQYFLKKEDVETDLIYNKTISLVGFCALCLYYSISCIIVNKKCIFTIGTIHDVTNVLKINNHTYFLEEDSFKNYISYYNVSSLFRSIEPISKYKVAELKEIAKKTNICAEGNKTKIYECLKRELETFNNL